MSYGQAEKPCETFKVWPANPGLCGRCAWAEREHKEKKMQPHQQRVVNERKELTDRREKLGLFIAGNIFASLPTDEQSRLRRQFDIMVKYEGVLQERIDHF